MYFLINYDLKKSGKNYDELIAAIETYDAWAKICRSCWAVKSNQTAKQIASHLMQFIDSDDVLFVCDFTNWGAYNLSNEVLDWLNN